MSSDALLVGGGVTSPAEARLASSGLLALQGPTALDVRTGVLVGPGSSALLTGTTDTGPMTVQINVHVTVGSRGNANGPYIGPTLEAPLKVNIAAAPGTGSRIDVVYSKQQDGNSGVPSPDVTTAPLYSVLQGVASSSPSKPDISTIVGATELGTVQVAAGATSTNGSGVTITTTARQTTTRGGVIPVPSKTDWQALTPYPSLQVLQLDKLYRLWHDGTRWRYEGDLVVVTSTADRDALAAYEGLGAYVIGGAYYRYTSGTWVAGGNAWTNLSLAAGVTAFTVSGAGGTPFTGLYENPSVRREANRGVFRGWIDVTSALASGSKITSAPIPSGLIPSKGRPLWPILDQGSAGQYPHRFELFTDGHIYTQLAIAAGSFYSFDGLGYDL